MTRAEQSNAGVRSPAATLASAVQSLCDGGRISEALEVGRLLVREHPWLAAGQAAYGRALFEAGDNAQAIEVLTRATLQFPSSVVAHRWLAEAFALEGDASNARAVVEKALALSSDNPRLRVLANQMGGRSSPPQWARPLLADDVEEETTARVMGFPFRPGAAGIFPPPPPIGHDDPTVAGAYPPWAPPAGEIRFDLEEVTPRVRTQEIEVVGEDTDEVLPVGRSGWLKTAIGQGRGGGNWLSRHRWLALAAFALLLGSATGSTLWLNRTRPRSELHPPAPAVAPTVARPVVTRPLPRGRVEPARKPLPLPAPEIAGLLQNVRVATESGQALRPLVAQLNRCANSSDPGAGHCLLALASYQRGEGYRKLSAINAARAMATADDFPSLIHGGTLLANLGDLPAAQQALARARKTAGNPQGVGGWLPVAIGLATGDTSEAAGVAVEFARDPEARLVASRAAYRWGGVPRLRAYLATVPAALIRRDDDLRWFALLARKSAHQGPHFASRLIPLADRLGPVSAYVAGLLSGKHRRLSAFWLRRALAGHGDRCAAARNLLGQLRGMPKITRLKLRPELAASGCLPSPGLALPTTP